MERLIYSNSIPSKFHSNSIPSRQLAPLHLTRKPAPCFPATPWSPGFLRSESRTGSSISCSLHGSAFLSANCVEIVSTSEDLPNGQEPKRDFLNKILQKLSRQQNVLLVVIQPFVILLTERWFTSNDERSISNTYLGTCGVFNAGTVILLSAICLILFYHPALVSPAFASFPSGLGSGTSAAVAAGGSLTRSELVSSAWTGLLAGCLHTLSGPDHLAALAPLSIGRTRMESAAVGALWGCGHDAGQLIFGLLFLLLKDRLHIEVIRTWGTRVVGLTLLVIGAMGIREASEVPAPCVALDEAERDVSRHKPLPNPTIGKKKIGFATFATGIVHGLQPDALMMILPALALPSRLAGAAFLFMFLIGTVVAMGSYTVFIGSCSQALKDRVPRITEKLTWASSLVAIALGVAILVSQVLGFSLY